jgi:hypothetical protein
MTKAEISSGKAAGMLGSVPRFDGATWGAVNSVIRNFVAKRVFGDRMGGWMLVAG